MGSSRYQCELKSIIIKRHRFRILEFSKLYQKFKKKFGELKKNLQPVFGLVTYRFVVNALTHCASLLGNNFGNFLKENKLQNNI